MVYTYFPKENYEDFAGGRVILHKSNYPNFPVRLAGELLCRCLEYIHKTKNICMYDPCCGSAYLLTVLGFLFNDKIETIYGSDINEEAVILSQNNLSLLSLSGIEKRKKDIIDLLNEYNKQSHMDALKSVDNLAQYIKHEIITNTFVTDILKRDALHNKKFCADIVITDVPYGNLARWTEETNNAIDMLLHTIIPVINMDTIVIIIHNKNQKINNQEYKKLRKYKVGHRLIEMMKLKSARR